MLFFVKNGFFQDDWKLNFSYQILKSTLTSESSFILTKYITWLPTKKPCDMSACPRTPAWSGFTTVVLSKMLKTAFSPYHGHFLWPLWRVWRTAACPASAHICLVQTSGEKSCFWCTSWKYVDILFLTSSPEVVFGAQAFCAELNPFCWTSLSSSRALDVWKLEINVSTMFAFFSFLY